MRSAGRGFTLIELLCVIGIIVLMIGLLLPALGRAHRAAAGATCMSNLHQRGQVTLMYANEHNGYLPRRGQGVQPTNQVNRAQDWFNALPPVLKMPPYTDLIAASQIPRPGGAASIWLCPQASDMAG